MGIKHFFYWFKQNHEDCLQITNVYQSLPEQGVEVDVLALDLNGMFHTAAQKIFKYGSKSNTRSPRLLKPSKPKTIQELRMDCFKEVCKMIDRMVDIVQPRKRLFLCVDGVAGLSKCQQQRQRRFKSAKERAQSNSQFDSCSITPGTKFMHYLNQYIEWHIYHRCNRGGDWEHLDVVFSSEKVEGEGEHKCKQLFKKYCDPEEKMMIYGLDADLIMLCLSTRLPNIYVYRDNMYKESERYVIDIGRFAGKLETQLKTKTAVFDFIFMCFLVGNDFLPQIPGLEILSNGIERMLWIYQEVITSDYGIFQALSKLEMDALKQKYLHRHKYNEDPILNKYFYLIGPNQADCDFEGYTRAYYREKVKSDDVQHVCREYIQGLQWVIQYYCNEIPSWTWFYPFHYAPFLNDLAQCDTYRYEKYPPTQPLDSFEQLLAVLPPQSAYLLPPILSELMLNPNSPLVEFYPSDFEIDLSGKRTEWEGIAILPIIEIDILRLAYQQLANKIESKDWKPNRKETTLRIVKRSKPSVWRSLFGEIDPCYVSSYRLDY
jgi:5'-3' exonuclease